MNKAFVKESDGDDEDELQPALKLPAGTRNYITPAGHARLKDELEHLVKRERPHVVEIVAWAASNGDRSENGDYIYGKRRLREIDRRIRFLTKRLDIAEVVDPLRQGENDQIFFGARVTVADADGAENTYTIVGVDEADVSKGRISWISPLARALIKAREGDSIRFQSPVGIREIDILEVRYETILLD
jgi:transcription elongation factor GreB